MDSETIFSTALKISVVGGIAFAVFAILYLKRSVKPEDFGKTLAELALKVSSLFFAVALGLGAYFCQRWIEDINAQIDQANEALSNIDMLQARFNASIERVYYKNDDTFKKFAAFCSFVDNDEDNHCETSRADAGRLTGSNLADMSDYFDYDLPTDTFFADFNEKLYAQTFLKRIVTSEVLQDMLANYDEISERFDVIKNAILSVKQMSHKNQNGLDKIGDHDPLSKADSEMRKFGHDVCCVVKSLDVESEGFSKKATKQDAAFCAIRFEIVKSIKRSTSNELVHLLTQSRLDEIERHVQPYRDDPSSQCAFKPSPDVD